MLNVAVVLIHKDGKPAHFYFDNGHKQISFDVFRPGSGRSLKTVFERLDSASQLLAWATTSNLVVPDLGVILRAFNLEELILTHQVRDCAIGQIFTSGNTDQDKVICKSVADKIKSFPDLPYQRVLAQAQSAYYGLENQSLILNYSQVFPKWSLSTFSGRSKCTGFNIQGWHEPDVIYQPKVPYKNVQIYFDWVCADFRIASLLSGDKAMEESFNVSDPYSFLSQQLVGDPNELREDAKLLLLSTINRLEYDNELVKRTFPGVCDWLYDTLMTIKQTGRSQNILSRPYVMSENRNEKSIFNAILQGSVACAMQQVMWLVRRKFPIFLVCDIHDGLVLSVPADSSAVNHIVSSVGKIFAYPFENVLPENPYFPFKVSIGNKWKEWKELKEN